MNSNRADPLIFVHEPYILNGKHPTKKIKNDWRDLPKIRAITIRFADIIPKTRPQTISGKSPKSWMKFGHKITELDSNSSRTTSKKKTKIDFWVLNKIRAITDLLEIPKLQSDRKKSYGALRKAWMKFGEWPARFEAQIAPNGCRNWGEPVTSPEPTSKL